MKIIHGLKIGGLQQKLFNLMLFFIIVLVGAYAAVSAIQRKNLSALVQEASVEQQAAITAVSEETMEAELETAMGKSTALQAYVADDLFGDVRADVLMLQYIAEQLYAHMEDYPSRSVAPPSAANDGAPAAQLICETGAEPERSRLLGVAANLSEIMLAMYEHSDKMSSIFIGTADGSMVLVNDRSGVFVSADGTPLTLDVRNRPWYRKAASAGEPVFTDVVTDAYTDKEMLEFAAPVYRDGALVAVVAADVYLDAIDDYVERTATDGGFVCVVNEAGHVLFAPSRNGLFEVARSANAPDLRESGNDAFARFVTEALAGNTALETIVLDGREYYMTGAPMPSVGWTVISVVDKEMTRQPTDAMLARYDEINETAREAYRQGAATSEKTFLALTAVILILASVGALVLAGRIVKPVERMTRRINALRDGDVAFEMEDAYRTGDEIEVLAESFATLSRRMRDYIGQITRITAEKERIGTELALATRIQADMLPNIFPAFPERSEFDIYATMDPAKEVGGGMEGMRYSDYTLTLAPGSKLFLYTDGVPEATNAEKALFGTERMLAALNEKPAAAPEELLRSVRRAVDAFVKDAEQFDDLTMLALEYFGKSGERQS